MHGDWDITRSIICMPDIHGPTDDMKMLAQEIANKVVVFFLFFFSHERNLDQLESVYARYLWQRPQLN